jgi:DNA primase
LQQEAIKSNYEILSLYGTNGLTEEHQKAIIELPQLEEIILMLNADEPGEAATAKHTVTLKQLLPAIKISKATLPEGEDVNSVLCTHDDTGPALAQICSKGKRRWRICDNEYC